MHAADVLAVFAADTHILEHTWASRPGIAGDSFFGFQQVVDWAVRLHAPLVLCGDTIELTRPGLPTSNTVGFVNQQLTRLRQAGQPVYYIEGQHCMSRPHWLSAISEHATNVDQKLFTLGGQRCYGLGFKSSDELAEQLRLAERLDFDGWVLHQQWGDLGGGGSGQGRLASLPVGKWVVTGDLHERKAVRLGGREVFSPGATHKRTMAEPDQHWCLAMLRQGKWAWLPLKSRPVYRLIVTSVPQFEEQLVLARQKLTELSQQLVDQKGYWPSVAVPLVLIEDRLRCHAHASAQAALGDVAHVELVASAVDIEAAPSVEAALDAISQPLAAKELDADERQSWALGAAGDLEPQLAALLRRQLSGEPLEATRKRFLSEGVI